LPVSGKPAINPLPASLLLATFRNISFKLFFHAVFSYKTNMIYQLQESPSLCDGKEGRAGAASENPQVYSSIYNQLVYFYVLYSTLPHVPSLSNIS
jgi:hypothetical protein